MSKTLSAAALKRRRNARRKARLSGGLKGAAMLGGFLNYVQCWGVILMPRGTHYLKVLLDRRVMLDAKAKRPPLSVLCVQGNSYVPSKGFDKVFHQEYTDEPRIPDIETDPVARKLRLQQIQRKVWEYYSK